MNDWSHGYDVSVGYTHTVCPEMAPDRLDFCARLAGHTPPGRRRSPSYRYLELGCGQGTNLCLLAAANPQAEFLGIDFLPEHIEHAEGLAAAAGLTNVSFRGDDFVALATAWPTDLGAFDYVTLHGIYTWVSPNVREAIVACLRHATAPGGLVYNGYNAQPGWLSTAPFQHITRLLKETTGKQGREVIDESINLFDRLQAGGAATFQILPGLKARLQSVKNRSTGYLTGEYLHDHWRPLWHSEIVQAFANADLSYLGSATLAETLLPNVLPPPLRDAVLAQPDPRVREDIQDFVVNQSFRRDIFLRGPRLEPGPAVDLVGETVLHKLSTPPSDHLVRTTFGQISLQKPAFADLLDALDAGSQTINDLMAVDGLRAQGSANVLQIALLLLHAQVLAVGPAAPDAAQNAEALNAVLARGAVNGIPYRHLAAAKLGSAIGADLTDLLLLDTWLASKRCADPAVLGAGFARRSTEGSETKGISELALSLSPSAVRTFLDEKLASWRAVGAIS